MTHYNWILINACILLLQIYDCKCQGAGGLNVCTSAGSRQSCTRSSWGRRECSTRYFTIYSCCPGWRTPFAGASSCDTLQVNLCDSSPCQNDGICVPDLDVYECECPEGFTGTHCESVIDPCESSPCQNGGTCVVGNYAYTCQCSVSFAGTHCEVVTPQCDTSTDPCTSYMELNDITRSTAYYIEDHEYIGDNELEVGWYRGIGPAGNDMPTDFVEPGFCSAAYPIYLTGHMPTEPGQLLDVTACASQRGVSDNECSTEYVIPIKYCGDYAVHCLGPTGHPQERYCMGNLVGCQDEDETVIEYQESCGELVELYENPEVFENGIHFVEDNWAQFPICRAYNKIHCDITNVDESIFVDVTWFVTEEGSFVPIETLQGSGTFAYDDLPAVLTIEDLINAGYTAGITVVCSMRARSNMYSSSGPARETSFFLGAVPQQTVFIIQENGDPVDFILDLTIPYVYSTFGDCDTDQILNPNINLGISVQIPDEGRSDDTCHPVDALLRLERDIDGDSPCIIEASSNQIVAQISANIDGTYNRERNIVVQLSTISDSLNPFWTNYLLPRAHVTIEDAEATSLPTRYCFAYNDPHFRNFDGMYFEVQLEGYFVMYQHTTLPIRVEVFFRNRGRYTSVCGAAVRSGSEVFVYDRCVSYRPAYVSAYDCNSQDLDIDRISSSEYKVYLPTGTVVHIGAHRGNRIYITPSMADWGQTEGLCGNLNNIRSNSDDLRLRDSFQSDSGRYPNRFSNSWRVPRHESLYLGYIYDHRQYTDVEFCGCEIEDGEAVAKCSSQSQVRYCVDGRHRLASEKARVCSSLQARKRRSTEADDDFEEERSFWIEDTELVVEPVGWQGNWTEESANDFCNQFINDRETVTLCANVSGVDVETAISDCVEDIYITGSTEYSGVHVSNILATCETELNRNIYPNENGTLDVQQNSILDVLDQICINDCSGHGTCNTGECQCEDGFTSSDCSVNQDHVPDLFDLPFSSLCDKTVRDCAEFAVFGDLFIAEQNVTCRVTIRNVSGVALSEPYDVLGEIIHFQKIICPIDATLFVNDTILTPYRIKLAISNNGVAFSDPKELIVYHSSCWSCSIENGCTQSNGCIEEGRCYADGESHDDIWCLECNGNSNTFSVQEGYCFIDDECYSDSAENPDENSLQCNSNLDASQWSERSTQKVEKSASNDNDTTLIIYLPLICVFLLLCVGLGVVLFLVYKSKTNANQPEPIHKASNPSQTRIKNAIPSRPNTPGDLTLTFVSHTDLKSIDDQPAKRVNMSPSGQKVHAGKRTDSLIKVKEDGALHEVSSSIYKAAPSIAPTHHALSSNEFAKKKRPRSKQEGDCNGSVLSTSSRPFSGASIRSNNSVLQNNFNRHGVQTSSGLTRSLKGHHF